MAYRTHIHHVDQWAVYETHDAVHMIAICPSCHDAVHHGPLAVDDVTIQRWKAIKRKGPPEHDHVWVEPTTSELARLQLGEVNIVGLIGIRAFDLGGGNHVGFALQEGNIVLIDLALTTEDGGEIVRVVNGHLRHRVSANVRYDRTSGHHRVTAGALDGLLPSWLLQKLEEDPTPISTELPLLDIEVIEPGAVKLQGVWVADGRAVVATSDRLMFMTPKMTLAMRATEGAGFAYLGPASDSPVTLFGFGTPGVIPIDLPEGR